MQLLDEILEVTNQMRFQAAAEEWDLLRQSEQRRQRLIADCFPLDDQISDPARAAEQIQQIIELDRSIMAMAGAARIDLSTTLSKLKQGRQATLAYRQTGF